MTRRARLAAVVGSSGPRLGSLWIALGCCHQFSCCPLVLPRLPRGSVRVVLPRRTEGKQAHKFRSDLAPRGGTAVGGAGADFFLLPLAPEARCALLGHQDLSSEKELSRRTGPSTNQDGIWPWLLSGEIIGQSHAQWTHSTRFPSTPMRIPGGSYTANYDPLQKRPHIT